MSSASVQVLNHPPDTNCYACGSRETVNACHHCGLLMCHQHGPHTRDGKGNLISVEFDGLVSRDEGPVHCESCEHVVRPADHLPIVLGVAAALIGALAFWLSVSSGAGPAFKLVVGTLSAAALAAGCVFAWHSYRAGRAILLEAIRSRPPLPLAPRRVQVSVLETLSGKIDFDSSDETRDAAGEYQASILSSDGALTVSTDFGREELDQLARYRAKYRLSESEEALFHLGFVELKGPSGLTFVDQPTGEAGNAPTIQLTGRVENDPFLNGSNRRGSGKWEARQDYRFTKVSEIYSLPVRISPFLSQEMDRRTLELELQWLDPEPGEARLTPKQISFLELRVPADWGLVQWTSDPVVTGRAGAGDNQGAWTTITWNDLTVNEQQRRERRRGLAVRFEDRIDAGSRISGRVEMEFQEPISELREINLYYPHGVQRQGREALSVTLESKIIADFNLSLSNLRYQDLRVVPDVNNAADAARVNPPPVEGVIPNYATVKAILQKLTEDGPAYYVKRVVEDPPKTAERSNVVNHTWDIGGRYYNGIFPIDFHLILTGEEISSGEIRALGGATRAILSVWGVYANGSMEEEIVRCWDELNHKMGQALGALAEISPFNSGSGGLPESESHAGPEVDYEAVLDPLAFDHLDLSQTIDDLSPPAVGLPVAGAPEFPPGEQSGEADRADVWEQRRAELLDALIQGRISEALYQQLRAEIDQKLGYMQ